MFHMCTSNVNKTVFNASAEKLKAEADSVRERLERERASVRAAREEASAVRSAQEKERSEARQKLLQLEAELEREKQVGLRWRTGRSVVRLVGWSFGRRFGRSVGRSFVRLVDWLVRRSVGVMLRHFIMRLSWLISSHFSLAHVM